MTSPKPRAHAQIYDRFNRDLIADTTQAREDDSPDAWWAMRNGSVQLARNDDGGGDVTLDHDHPAADALTYRNVVRLLRLDIDPDTEAETEHVLGAFTITDVDWTEVSSGGEGQLTREASGDGLLARLREARVVPWLPLGEKPLTDLRIFNALSPGLPTDDWGGVYQHFRVAQTPEMRRPVALPEPVSSWISAYDEDDPQPLGDAFLRREVYLDADTEMVIFGTADDRFGFWWDGAEIDRQDPEFPGNAWWYTWRSGLMAAGGWHTFGVRYTNDGGPTAALVGAWTTDGTAIVEPVFVTGTDSGNPFIGEWLSYPASSDPPGYTGTAIMMKVVQEGFDRGCWLDEVGDPALVLDFTATEDSNGATVPRIAEVVARVGQHTVRDVVDLLEPWYDFRMVDDDGLTLQMFLKDPTPPSSGVVLAEGDNLVSLSHKGRV